MLASHALNKSSNLINSIIMIIIILKKLKSISEIVCNKGPI